MGMELSDDGWSQQQQNQPQNKTIDNNFASREPTLPRSRRPSKRDDDKASTNSHHTQRSFFGGIRKKGDNSSSSSSSDGEADDDTEKAYSYRSSMSTGSKIFSTPSVAPESNIFGGPKPIEDLHLSQYYLEKDLIEFSRSSHSNVRYGSNTSTTALKQSVHLQNVGVKTFATNNVMRPQYSEQSTYQSDQINRSLPHHVHPRSESEKKSPNEAAQYPQNNYPYTTGFGTVPSQVIRPTGVGTIDTNMNKMTIGGQERIYDSNSFGIPRERFENIERSPFSLGTVNVATNTSFGIITPQQVYDSHRISESQRQPKLTRDTPDACQQASNRTILVTPVTGDQTANRTILVTPVPVESIREGPNGFGSLFDKDFRQPETKPREAIDLVQDAAEPQRSAPLAAAGFGNKGPTKSAGYIKHIREDSSRTPSTFVPPEIKPEVLFKNRIKPGTRFEEFFHTNVDITRCGMKNTTRIDRITSFDAIHLTQEIRSNVKLCEYEYPTPVQQHTMPLISEGLDVLACAQTGCGKTAAFLLPIISRLLETKDIASPSEIACCPRCLIIAPTRELTVQIHEEGKKFAFNAQPSHTGIHVKAIYGGTSVDFQKRDIKGASILVATVGRLMHFLQDGCVNLDKIKFLVLDEADRMLDMGFGKDIEKIMEMKTLPQPSMRQTLMFSATFPTEVQMIAQKLLRSDYVMVTVDKVGIASRCVQQEFIQVEQEEKIHLVLKLLDVDLSSYAANLKSGVFQLKTIIFVATKGFADTLGAFLCEANIPSTTIHGDRMQSQRAEAMRDFVSGRKAVLIATGVAERGLDIRGVDHVINYDLPVDIESYIHRIGRTGRIGNPGRASSFFTNADIPLAPHLVRVLKDVGQPIPPFLEPYGGGTPAVQLTSATGFGQGSQEVW